MYANHTQLHTKPNHTEYILGYVTCTNKAEALRIAKILLAKKLIACANIIDNLTSVYLWQEALQEEVEVLLLIKSIKTKSKSIIKTIKMHHSYKVPCIIFYDIVGSNSDFFNFINTSCL